ncbi:MAG: mannitol dehydrogenase family protein [Armatimonadota bacterium]
MTVQTSKPEIVIIGAGATGRGHIGQLAHDAGFHITFIERRRDLVDCLAKARRFTVGLAGENIVECEVNGFEIYHIDDPRCADAISNADILATAVIPTNLKSTIPNITAGLKLRMANGISKPLNVIACENMERSSSTLKGYLKEAQPDLDWEWIDAHVAFPDSMVARAIPIPHDPLFLLSEGTQEWSVDGTAILHPMPHLEAMTISSNQAAALERKLYIKNTGHMSIGVLGFHLGYELMDEAARDPEVFELVDAATRESATAVVKKHGFPAEEMELYRSSFLEQMRSPFLPDEIYRVIREPIRKLEREERLIGPAMLVMEQGGNPVSLAKVIRAAFELDNPSDPQAVALKALLQDMGLSALIEKISGISADHALNKLICAADKFVE